MATSPNSLRLSIPGAIFALLWMSEAVAFTDLSREDQPPHSRLSVPRENTVTDGQSQPPPPLATLLRAVAWWQAEGHGRLPTRLIVHLPTFIPLYLSYAAIDDPKSVVPFEAWLLLNGVGDPGLRDCLVELFRLAKLCR